MSLSYKTQLGYKLLSEHLKIQNSRQMLRLFKIITILK